MPFHGSDLWKVRQKWGSQPILWPGVTVLVFNDKSQLWLGKRQDNGQWSVAGGHFEIGDSAESCARREIREELGCELSQLTMYGVLTDGEATTTHHANGDQVQAPNFLFRGNVVGEVTCREEHSAFRWVHSTDGMELFGLSSHALAAHQRWLKTGQFQIG